MDLSKSTMQTVDMSKAEVKVVVMEPSAAPACYGSTRFCPPECQWLSPTETEQDAQKFKAPHYCGKYGRQLVHGNQHPNIYRATCCEEP